MKPPPPPGEVVVVREAGEAQEAVGELKESLAKKLTQAADSIRSRAGAASETDSSRVASAVVVLADEASHQNLRAVESVSVGETELSLCFEERQVIEAGEVSIGESGAVAVVEVGSDLRRLAARLADFLAFGKPRESPLAGDTDCLTGTILGGKYRVVRRIGKGGFGAVYEARDERIGSRVAIKLLNPGAARTAEDTRAFKDEARRLTRLDHPNIVDWKVFDEAEDGTCYFVMELLEGENLASVLKREGKLPVDRALNILLQVLDALRRAHHLSESESILHLDLKPKNVIVLPARAPGEAERVKVIDFGIGQYIGGAEEESSGGTPREVLDEATAYTSIRSERHRRTDCPDPGPAARSGRVRRASSCTPEYASPEQCAHMVEEGELLPLDGRSDLYSFGVMAFQMLAGRFPFDPPEADDRLEWLTIHREVPPQKMGSMGVRMPRELARFIDRCLVKDRDARWKNTPEAWQALHQIAHPPVWKQVARVAAPLLAVAALALWFYWPEAPAPPFSLYTMGDDLDLADQPLYLGPEKASVLLRAGDVELAGAGKLRIVAIDDGSTLEGWKAELRTDGQIVLSAPSPASDSPPGRFHRRVYVAEEGGKKPSLRSRDFELIYLGAESWHLATVEIAGLEGRALDPAGLQLDIWIMGEGRTDLHSVRVRQGGLSYTAPLDEIHARADTSLYRLPLDELRLASGEATLTIEAT
ncbi:MAG: serine/threonine-protein kinase, partial [Planctomycetota bacterium]